MTCNKFLVVDEKSGKYGEFKSHCDFPQMDYLSDDPLNATLFNSEKDADMALATHYCDNFWQYSPKIVEFSITFVEVNHNLAMKSQDDA